VASKISGAGFDSFGILGRRGEKIAVVLGEADAVAMAAVPELLQAARDFVQFAKSAGYQFTADSPIGRADAAIRKATQAAA
jgi:hypothetical protein